MFRRGEGSGDRGDGRQIEIGEVHSLGKHKAEPLRKHNLSGVRLRDAAPPDHTVRRRWQDDVV
jgi:hypothetical protein